jgi:4-amino-4-deoxy-L-arabinose transferase-like glycosyltransferase
MAEPTPPHFVVAAARAGRWPRVAAGLASLPVILQVALGLRILAADVVDLYVHRAGPDALCIFPDTKIYWGLARTIRAGTVFEYVEWSDIPHFALRTPGYPLFLAGCQSIFGDRTLAVRLVQALLGTLSVYLVYRLTWQVAPRITNTQGETIACQRWTAPVVAAAITAINPYYLLMSSLLLSEAVFVPLMLAALWGLSVLWVEPGRPSSPVRSSNLLPALGSGVAAGMALLVRPSWALFVPAVLASWLYASRRDRTALIAAARGAAIFVLGLTLVMSPWWVRNARIYARFVPTALWMGASLYDGLNKNATGASDMSFLADREIWPLDEQDQDAELSRRALAFTREHPAHAMRLALVKFGRYWCPWPNAEGFRAPALALASLAVEIPLFALLALGGYDRRRDVRAWALLAGPIVYFCALHLVFASSVRYRIPGEMPAMGLAAIGWARLLQARGS